MAQDSPDDDENLDREMAEYLQREEERYKELTARARREDPRRLIEDIERGVVPAERFEPREDLRLGIETTRARVEALRRGNLASVAVPRERYLDYGTRPPRGPDIGTVWGNPPGTLPDLPFSTFLSDMNEEPFGQAHSLHIRKIVDSGFPSVWMRRKSSEPISYGPTKGLVRVQYELPTVILMYAWLVAVDHHTRAQNLHWSERNFQTEWRVGRRHPYLDTDRAVWRSDSVYGPRPIHWYLPDQGTQTSRDVLAFHLTEPDSASELSAMVAARVMGNRKPTSLRDTARSVEKDFFGGMRYGARMDMMGDFLLENAERTPAACVARYRMLRDGHLTTDNRTLLWRGMYPPDEDQFDDTPEMLVNYHFPGFKWVLSLVWETSHPMAHKYPTARAEYISCGVVYLDHFAEFSPPFPIEVPEEDEDTSAIDALDRSFLMPST